MTTGVPARTTAVWLGLMAITIASFWIGTGHAPPGVSTGAAAAGVLAAAFVKAALVGWHFMEIRDAAMPLRVAFCCWVVVAGCTSAAFLVS